jgi:hypothetical protein
MTKPILSALILSTVGVAAAPVFADTAKKPAPARPQTQEQLLKQLNYGESFGLRSRASEQPKVAEQDPTVQIKSLTDSQVNKVVKDKLVDVENCWLKLPAAKRVTSSATLHIAVENGMVVAARIDGELPKGVAQCITAATDRWAFPVTDSRSELEQGIVLNAR